MKNKIVEKLNDEVNELKFQMNHRKLYNFQCFLIKFLAKTGMAINKLFPFALAYVMVFNSNMYKKNKPFHRDMVIRSAYIQSVDTSKGTHHKEVCSQHKQTTFEYSTAWTINNLGMYQRTITTYKVNDKIDLSNLDEVLNMTKEEIDTVLKIIDAKVITKRELNDSDKVYDEDVLTITQYTKAEDQEVLRLENNLEIICHSALFMLIVYMCTGVFVDIKKVLIKNVIEDKLNAIVVAHKYISVADYSNIRKILEIRQANLALVQEETDLNNGFCRIRRR